ncbi:hypothetical protein GCM10020001_009670 [Nonomuraea salmonea]
MSLSHAQVQAQLTGPGQLFEMEEIGGTGVRTWKHAPPHYRALLEMSRFHGDKVFLVYEDEHITFEDHFRRVATLARRLVEDYGVSKGDRVAVAMRNYPEWVISFSAVLAAGAIAVPLNAWWTEAELAYGVTDSGAKVLIADGERAVRLASTGVPMIVARGEAPDGARAFDDVLGEIPADVSLPEVEPAPPTTPRRSSTPPAPPATPRARSAATATSASPPMTVAYGLMRAVALSGKDVGAAAGTRRITLLTVPLFHVTGCFSAMTTTMFSGGGLVLMYKWDPEKALQLIERERVTAMIGVPTNAWQLMSHPDFGKYDLSSLSTLGYGGAPPRPSCWSASRRTCPTARPPTATA